MLKAVPKGLLSSDYLLLSDEASLTELDVSSWRERAEFEVAGERYQLYREGMLGGDFVLQRGEKIVARADKPSAFSSRFDVTVDGQTYQLRKLSVWGRAFALFHGEREVGRIAPAGLFTRRAHINLPASWSLAVQLFVFWLVLVIWRRDDSAAAG